jgi:hypothetical protein
VREVVLSVPDLCARRVPDLDVKTGERVTRWTAVEVFALPQWAFLALPLGPLSSALLRVTRRRGVLVELPVTGGTTRRRRAVEVVAGSVLVAGVLALLEGGFRGRGSLVVLGAVLLVAGALVATVGLSAVWVRGRLEGNGIRLRGVHRAFSDGVAFVRAVGRSSPEAAATLVRSSLPPF